MDIKDVIKDWEMSTDKKLVEGLVKCFEENTMREIKLTVGLLEAMKPVVATILSVAYGASLSINRRHDCVDVEVSFSTAEDVEFVVDTIARITEEMFSGRVMRRVLVMWRHVIVVCMDYVNVTLYIGRMENNVVSPEVRVVVCLKQ